MDLFFLGSNVEQFKEDREIQKQQYLGIGYTFMLSRLKESLDPQNVFVKDKNN